MKKKTFILLTAGFTYVLAACGGGEQKSETTTNAPAATETVVKSEEKPKSHPGKATYMTYCLTCHQAEGEGVPNMYPPLAGTDWVTGDKTRLISTVLNGLNGEIEVNGEKYNNVMASHSFLSDKQIADVLSYIRQSFGNEASEITPSEVAEVRKSS